MTNTIYTSLEGFREISAMLDERARLIIAMRADKEKLKTSSLDVKIQSSRYFLTQIEAINAKLEGLQGKTIVAA